MSFFDPFDGIVRPVAAGARAEDQTALNADMAKRNRDSQKLMASTRLRNVQSVREGLALQLATVGPGDPGRTYGLKRDIARLDAEAQELGQTLADVRSAEAQELRARADAIQQGR